MLYLAKKVWGLRPLAVHFNDGFGNPVTGKNMLNATKNLDIELRTITSDWREAKDLRIALLKSSTLNFGISTDIGLFNALFGTANKENIKYILVGHSFRTEGIVPLVWSYLDGYNMKKIHQKFGSLPLRKWRPNDPGFNYDIPHIFYYGFIKRIKILTPLYYSQYIRSAVDEMLEKEVGWVNSGAHYYDDLYQSLLFYLERIKYNVDRRKPNYSALIRSGQMDREDALNKIKTPYIIEDPAVINLCIKRLGLTKEEFAKCVDQPPKYFYDFPNRYTLMKYAKPAVKLLCLLNMIPKATYEKYYHCG
ncbi:MAG TPA: adenine nucleotide alpha hydrolase [Candidatus Latescibacteria bacterium]|nr:adenine nucleotide alpha hydrolase [Candidatus Latescibacterota bacterium]